jgi:hypothetical protein
VTTVRIAHAEPRPGRLANGGFHTRGYLVVLADDAGHRAVPIWMPGAGDVADLLERPADQIVTDGVPAELTTRLLGAARARVTGVDIDFTEAGAAELSPEVTVARIGLAGPAGTRQVTADLGLGLALAAAAGAPVRLADAALDRLAVPVPGDDLLTRSSTGCRRPRPGPAGNAGRWPRCPARGPATSRATWTSPTAWTGGTWTPGPAPPRTSPTRTGRVQRTASGTTRPPSTARPWSCPPPSRGPPGPPPWSRPSTPTTTTAPPLPSAARSAPMPSPGQAGLRLEILRHWEQAREDHGLTIASRRRDWTRYEITVPIPADADLVRFGIALTGPGRIALRNPDLRRAEPGAEPDAGTP